MRFYVPDWDDHVDANYDFLYDVHSEAENSARENLFLWDVFEGRDLPADGLLLSRDSVTQSAGLRGRLNEHGIYGDPRLNIPSWLPTISDCGAWGYRDLPFPKYGIQDLIDFYDRIGVRIGVTPDHVVWKGPNQRRLYLDERAYDSDLISDDALEDLRDTDGLDVFVTEWPDLWPDYVREFDSDVHDGVVEQFTPADFEGSPEEICSRLESSPSAVFREQDNIFRQNLSEKLAQRIREEYDPTEDGFRLMAAVQGWDPESYAKDARKALEQGYDCLGIGGLAGARANEVAAVVDEVGDVITEYESEHGRRVDVHVFGFAKTELFEAVRDAGVTSFDSTSMLIAAWTGGKNYHLDSKEQYDAVRVRFPLARDERPTQIEKAIRGQEMIRVLEAYDAGNSISEALESYYDEAEATLDAAVTYLQDRRHADGYDVDSMMGARVFFREDFDCAVEFKGTVGEPIWRDVIHLLRKDTEDDPRLFEEYEEHLRPVRQFLSHRREASPVRSAESIVSPKQGTFEALSPYLREYTEAIGDTDKLDGYRETLKERPWERCSCPFCEKHGIQMCIFRGNNRNRRRGFHNMYRFGLEMAETFDEIFIAAALPKPPSARCDDALRDRYPEFWSRVVDLPSVELGALTPDGAVEWWDRLDTDAVADRSPESIAAQFERILLYDPNHDSTMVEAIEEAGCTVDEFDSASELQSAAMRRLRPSEQQSLTEF
ncbi:queuine tRNA-ribosyltransferase tRNA-guanine transglycosylase [Halorubrum sp. Eb13]|uniref:queuine tRNA-ribosyltransferase tRNA-guanine transglycosylase n=1 Tax=Halorubrum sp. Eb13 TaxID=1383843 RepID=UPI00113FDAE0|nr:queuine tRNA-ribosyltransferase tRNA-guanine transglycosylase [Halorubrum sp. Eb13]